MFVFTIVCVYTFPFPLWHVRVLRVILNINQSINHFISWWNHAWNLQKLGQSTDGGGSGLKFSYRRPPYVVCWVAMVETVQDGAENWHINCPYSSLWTFTMQLLLWPTPNLSFNFFVCISSRRRHAWVTTALIRAQSITRWKALIQLLSYWLATLHRKIGELASSYLYFRVFRHGSEQHAFWDQRVFLRVFSASVRNFLRMLSVTLLYFTALFFETAYLQLRKKRHLRTITQLCLAIYSQLRHISTIGKNC